MAKSLKLNPDLLQRAERHAAAQGYSSTEEFLEHLIDQELSRPDSDESTAGAKEMEKQLRGLGYLE